MNEVLKDLVANPTFIISMAFLGAVGTAGTFYGLYLTIRLFKLGLRLPRYTMRSQPVFVNLTNKIPELTISYSGYGKSIENLTITKILLWNAGRTPIRKEDVPEADPIRLRVGPNCTILHASVLITANAAANCQVSYNKRTRDSATISFDFMDFNQPCLVKIVHTGKSGADLQVCGQVVGAGSLEFIPYHKFASKRGAGPIRKFAAVVGQSRWRILVGLACVTLSLFTCFFSAVKIKMFFEQSPDDAWQLTQIELMIYALPAIILALTGHYILYRIPPQFFDEFEAEV
jgi:hypothetical protein